MEILAPAPQPDKDQKHLFFSSLKPLWTGLGTCSALPRKSHYVSNRAVHTLLVAAVASSVLKSKLISGGRESCLLWGNHKTETKLIQILEFFDLDFKNNSD